MVAHSKVPTTTLAIKAVGKRRNICPLPLLYMRVNGRGEADSALYGCIMGDAGNMCVPSPMYVMPECVGGGGASQCVMRCGGAAQRGVGVDHLAQVQQKSVQTDRRFFSTLSHSFSYSFMPVQDCVRYYSTPSPITTLRGTVVESYNSSKASNLYLESCYRRQSVQNTADFVISGDGSVILRDPWVLVTLLCSSLNHT